MTDSLSRGLQIIFERKDGRASVEVKINDYSVFKETVDKVNVHVREGVFDYEQDILPLLFAIGAPFEDNKNS